MVRMSVLHNTLYTPLGDDDGPEAVLREAGGRLAASVELRELTAKYRDLLRHVTWFGEQRKFRGARTCGLTCVSSAATRP